MHRRSLQGEFYFDINSFKASFTRTVLAHLSNDKPFPPLSSLLSSFSRDLITLTPVTYIP